MSCQSVSFSGYRPARCRFGLCRALAAFAVMNSLTIAQTAHAGGPVGNTCSDPIEVFEGVPFNNSNVGATGTDDSDCGGTGDTNDIWHSWVAPCDGQVTVSLCGSDFDTTVSVFANVCPPLLNIACNDDSCGSQSELTFSAFFGTTYLIRVAGFNGASGNYSLTITCPPMGACCGGGGEFGCFVSPPDGCNFGTYLGDGTDCVTNGTACATGACCLTTGCQDLSQFDCQGLSGIYLNDGTNCIDDACPPLGACCAGGGSCFISTEDSCVNDSFGTYLGDGSDCSGNICSTGACCVMGSCTDGVDQNDCFNQGGTYIGDATQCATSVCNDDCSDATEVFSGVPVMGTNVGATGTDITSCTLNDTASVWYRWMADCDGDVRFSLCGSGFDTAISAWDDCFQTTQLACNDDSCSLQSEVTVSATIGTEYFIRVAGYNGATGNFTLEVICPPVGACCTGGGMCAIMSEGACTTGGGAYLGDASTCEVEGLACSTGACCLMDGTCTDTGNETDCDNAGGLYNGDSSTCAGTTCPAVGACCTAGVCDVVFQPDCVNGGGAFLGDGSTCGPESCFGACCSDGVCSVVSQENCTASGDIFFGIGTDCTGLTCPGDGFIQLGYNWNGMVHPGEAGVPNAPDGYRSISDRGFLLGQANSVDGGIFSRTSGNRVYFFQSQADVVDVAYIGSGRTWDTVADADNSGVAPNWDPSAGGGAVATSTSTFPATGPLDTNFEMGVIYHGHNGGGDFNMTLGFSDFTSVTVTLGVPDWFANFNPAAPAPDFGVASQAIVPGPLSGGDGFLATGSGDNASSDAPLNLVEAVIDFNSLLTGVGFDVTGKELTSITFDNFVGSGGVAVFAASISQPGACCLAGGMCTDSLRDNCNTSGGTFLGDGTNCADDGSACAIGACCFNDASCVDGQSEFDCLNAGGFFIGNGTDCATNSCPPLGGCCTSTGPGTFTCTIDFGSTCINAGGTYLQDGSDCSFGCDCDNSGVIDLFELSEFTDCDGNNVIDSCESTDPSTVGGCCVEGVCSIATSLDCDNLGGLYQGDCTTCDGIFCPGDGYIQLAYNWNGLLHPGEDNMPDAPEGYRSISDRGMLMGEANSIGQEDYAQPSNSGSLTYYFESRDTPALDTIFFGGRRPNGNPAWDNAMTDPAVGTAPTWDPTAGTGDFFGTVVTNIPASDPLGGDFELGVLYNSGNLGGNFDLTLGFMDGSSVTVTLDVPDWFANNNPSPSAPAAGVASQALLPGPLSFGDGFAAVGGVDFGSTDAPLNIVEARVTAASLLSAPVPLDVVGRQLTSVTFGNFIGTNGGSSMGIYAASFNTGEATCSCTGDVSGDNQIDGGDVQGFVNCLIGTGGDCSCADINGGGLDITDVADFVNNLLTVGPACP